MVLSQEPPSVCHKSSFLHRRPEALLGGGPKHIYKRWKQEEEVQTDGTRRRSIRTLRFFFCSRGWNSACFWTFWANWTSWITVELQQTPGLNHKRLEFYSDVEDGGCRGCRGLRGAAALMGGASRWRRKGKSGFVEWKAAVDQLWTSCLSLSR